MFSFFFFFLLEQRCWGFLCVCLSLKGQNSHTFSYGGAVTAAQGEVPAQQPCLPTLRTENVSCLEDEQNKWVEEAQACMRAQHLLPYKTGIFLV